MGKKGTAKNRIWGKIKHFLKNIYPWWRHAPVIYTRCLRAHIHANSDPIQWMHRIQGQDDIKGKTASSLWCTVPRPAVAPMHRYASSQLNWKRKITSLHTLYGRRYSHQFGMNESWSYFYTCFRWWSDYDSGDLFYVGVPAPVYEHNPTHICWNKY